MRKKKNHYTYNFGAIYRVLYDFLLVMIEIDRERFHSVFFPCIHSSRYTRRPFVFPSVGLTFKICVLVPYLFHVRGLNGWFHLSVAVSVAVFHVAVRFSNG